MTQWQDVFLRFDSEAEWVAAKVAAGWQDLCPTSVVIDVIGRLRELPIENGTDADGSPLFLPGAILPGWHVNLRLAGVDPPMGMAALAIAPDNPQRIWA